MGETAHALWFVEPGRVEVREEKIEAGPGEVVVRSELIGISHGTEMLFFTGTAPKELEADLTLPALGGKIGYPIKYGYINVGMTPNGDRVFAFFPHQNVFAARERELVGIPPEMDAADAVFLAHMETAVGIVHDAALLPGETALVLGQGTVGLLVAEILARSSFVKVITVEPLDFRRSASRKVGCTALSPRDGELSARILELTGGRGVDVAINTSGSPAALQTAIDTLAFEGTAVEASWYGREAVPLELGRAFHRKRLSIKSSQVSRIDSGISGRWDKRRRMKTALDLLEAIGPSKYITHRFPLGDAQSAFDLIRGSAGKVIQVVLEPAV